MAATTQVMWCLPLHDQWAREWYPYKGPVRKHIFEGWKSQLAGVILKIL